MSDRTELATEDNKGLSVDGEYLPKHANLVHSRSSLTGQQRRIANVMFKGAYDDYLLHGRERIVHEMPRQDFLDAIGWSENNHRTDRLKDDFIAIQQCVWEFNIIDRHKGRASGDDWRSSTVIASAEMVDGMVRWQISEVMRERLVASKAALLLDMAINRDLRGKYSLALYENVGRYREHGMTDWLPVEVLRNLLSVPEGAYTRWAEFERNVLRKAEEEVNEKTDLYIVRETRKVNRGIGLIRYLVQRNDNADLDSLMLASEPVQAREERLSVALAKAGMLRPDFDQLRERFDLASMESAWQYTLKQQERKREKGERIDNLPGYFRSALENEWSIGSAVTQRKKAPQKSTPPLRKKPRHPTVDPKAVIDWFNSQPESIRKQLEREYVQRVLTAAELALYRKDGIIDHRMMESVARSIAGVYLKAVDPELSFGGKGDQ